MKKLLVLASLLLAVLQAFAANVDAVTAKATALKFIQSNANMRFQGVSATDIRLLHTEYNTAHVDQALFYIFDTSGGFVIVSGDDRARQILAYGDYPLSDIGQIPKNMAFWLSYYKNQMEFLQSRPEMNVRKVSLKTARSESVAPMIEAMWNQGDPYYGMCPMAGDRRAQTGCAATSLAQVFYKWKYPTSPTPVIPGYTTAELHIELPALPSIRFDWDNMLPTYTIFSPDENKQAVAQLMRYIGQAEHMDYTAEYGQAFEDDIVAACHTFGYMGAHVAYKSILYANGVDSVYIEDDTWEEMLQAELVDGRPVVYCAVSPNPGYENSYMGHAFNVDGYNAADGTYHINWGWSGNGNGYFALNAFVDGNYHYNLNQLMIMGIEPPAPIESYTPVMLPADSAYINLTEFRADWTDETPAENVTSYTLEVTTDDGSGPGVYEKVLTETFNGATSNGSRPLTKFDSYCDNAGWTGSNVYEARKALRLGGGGTPGILTSPAVDMTQSGGKMTVVITMKPYQSTDNNVPVTISCGNSMESFIVTEEVTQTVVLSCDADASQKVTIAATDGGNTKRLAVSRVEIWSSTASAAKMRLSGPVETGDSTSRLITDITNKFYTVKNLTAGGAFNYRVKACYVNLTESEWSNIETVTLFENGPAPHGYEMGDVNHDGSIDVADVSKMIAYILGNDNDICPICAEIDGNEGIDVSDVTLLITLILNAH